jgi:hypothetical protein
MYELLLLMVRGMAGIDPRNPIASSPENVEMQYPVCHVLSEFRTCEGG